MDERSFSHVWPEFLLEHHEKMHLEEMYLAATKTIANDYLRISSYLRDEQDLRGIPQKISTLRKRLYFTGNKDDWKVGSVTSENKSLQSDLHKF